MPDPTEALRFSDTVDAVTDERASFAGRAAGQRVKKVLDRYGPDGSKVISIEQLEQIKNGEADRAAREYAAERERGEHNDLYSTSVGVAGVLRLPQRAVEDYAWFVAPETPTIDGPSFEPLGQDDNFTYFVFELPKGAYNGSKRDDTTGDVAANHLAVHLYEDPVAVGTSHVRGSEGSAELVLSPAWVITLQGSEGELWQNPQVLELPEFDAATEPEA